MANNAPSAGCTAAPGVAGWRAGRAEEAKVAGLDEEALAALDGALLAHVDGMTPGLVTLVALGEEVHVTAEGRQDFGGPRMRRDTIFRIASMTKPVAAAAR